MKILVTTTSFQDTPGRHLTLLKDQNYELDYLRGPIKEEELMPIIEKYDGVLCGDDEYTRQVLEKGAAGKLKYLSKYGVGLDKVDLHAAKELGIQVTNCPGVNQVSVAEHVLALLFTFEKNIHQHDRATSSGQWNRYTGHEVQGKTIGIVGLGAIGKELSKKALALGLNVIAFDVFKNEEFLSQYPEIEFVSGADEIFSKAEIISLHVPHNEATEMMINHDVIFNQLKNTPIIINTSRGMLVDPKAIKEGLAEGKIRGYLTDVLIDEPMVDGEELSGVENVIITPHVGSRTFQSVERQGLAAVQNLISLVSK